MKILTTDGERTTILIRVMVGAVFLSEGIQKFLFASTLGAGRMEKIGIPFPEFTGPFVGTVEIVAGLLVLIGAFTRLAAIPLMLIMLTAIATTKTKVLADEGFWPMLHGSRTDWAMLLGSIFLIIRGGGRWSVDRKVFMVAASLFCITTVQGQTQLLSIKETVERVETHLPQLEYYRLQADASKENLALAKNTLMPDLDIGYQANMATFNNITGMNFPGLTVPISGPPSASNIWNFVPGTLAGALFKWQPITFGQRKAAIETASAQFRQANASFDDQLFRYQYTAVQYYLEILLLQKNLRISEAVIDRIKLTLLHATVLAESGLKAGIDTAQLQSTLLQAEIEQLKVEKELAEKCVALGNLTGLEQIGTQVILKDTAAPLLLAIADTAATSGHPAFKLQQSQRNYTAALQAEQKKEWLPKLEFWGTLYGRGSGINAAGEVNKAEGWQLSRTNAGVGVQLSFPLLQFSRHQLRKKQLNNLLKADDAALKQVDLDIRANIERAVLQYQKDAAIAQKTPEQLRISRAVYDALTISYQSGLIDFTRLYQAQYELTQAEVTNDNAQVQLWQGLLSIAVARGNLSLFLDSIN